jgi:FMN-dependent NADH-azoreductase
MPTLLAIEVSPRHGFSTSRRLTAHFVDAWKAAHPGSVVVVRARADIGRSLSPIAFGGNTGNE